MLKAANQALTMSDEQSSNGQDMKSVCQLLRAINNLRMVGVPMTVPQLIHQSPSGRLNFSDTFCWGKGFYYW